jgi:hypothetical protein
MVVQLQTFGAKPRPEFSASPITERVAWLPTALTLHNVFLAASTLAEFFNKAPEAENEVAVIADAFTVERLATLGAWNRSAFHRVVILLRQRL